MGWGQAAEVVAVGVLLLGWPLQGAPASQPPVAPADPKPNVPVTHTPTHRCAQGVRTARLTARCCRHELTQDQVQDAKTAGMLVRLEL